MFCLLVTYWHYLLWAGLFAIVIWYFKFYLNQKAKKQQKKEELALAEKERKLALEKRKLNLDNQEKELQSQRASMEDTEWQCSYCRSINLPNIQECPNYSASRE